MTSRTSTLRLGHYQEPFNVEELDNDQDYTFMERDLTMPLRLRTRQASWRTTRFSTSA